MEEFPLALILASQEEVFHNNNVLYRLVRPLPGGSGVQSADRLVNVVPFRRVYTFHRKQEVLEFEQLILARPLVLQPILHFGRGIGSHCGACYNDEPWIVMLNQTHPKILGRFQMGMDLAKQAIEKGQSVEMKFCFTSLIQRIYNEHLQQKEKAEAESMVGEFLALTRFAEWEHADLVIRYHGYEPKTRIRNLKSKTFHKEWDFDDIGSHEMQWNQIGQEISPLPHNAPVSNEELRTNLPSWTINEVSPLQDYGYELPKQNYSYAQAGRLYESFRKKKRQRPPNPTQSSTEEHIEGAGACASSSHMEVDQHSPSIEHDFPMTEEKRTRSMSRARQAYMEQENMHYANQDVHASSSSSPYANHHEDEYVINPSSEPNQSADSYYASSRNERGYDFQVSVPRKTDHSAEKHYYNQHVDAKVLIHSSKSPSQQDNTQNQHDEGQSSSCYLNSAALTKRDSDRSHCSTNADSGYGDGQRSRGSSYDYNDHSVRPRPRSKHTIRSHDHRGNDSDEGLDNPAFHHDHSEVDAMERHKKFVADMLAEQNNLHTHGAHIDPKSNVSYAGTKKEEGIAESFI